MVNHNGKCNGKSALSAQGFAARMAGEGRRARDAARDLSEHDKQGEDNRKQGYKHGQER